MKRPLVRARLALGGLVLLGACKEQATEAPPIRPVLSVVVAPLTSRTLGFTGTVEPRYKVSLGFRVLGRMIARTVDVGDPVKAGLQLAAIDPVALELAVRSATADVSTAQAQLANASGIEGRQKFLAQRNVSTQAQLEGAQEGQDTASASLRRAEANLAKAKEQLGYAALRSDTEGVVTAVGAQVGQVVSPGQTVVTIARPDVREAAVDVPDDIARDLKPGAPFEVAPQLDPQVRIAGKVREIGPQADATTRTRRVLISLADNTEMLRLGTTITASLETPAAATIDLPRPAILERDGKSFVWIVDPAANTVSAHEIKVAPGGGVTVRVADGLTAGTRVVVAGVNSLRAGQQVKILDEAPR